MLASERSAPDFDMKSSLLRNDDVTAQTNQEELLRSCDPGGVAVPDQQGAAELRPDSSRSAELQTVGSLTVTIQQHRHSRAFGLTERRPGRHCHVCKLTCESLQVFQDHLSGPEHVKNLQEVTRLISQNTSVPQRGRRLQTQRWCDTCQTHFSGNVIVHRRTPQHKVCKQRGRPFCPPCGRSFRTPRKFVEHMKSEEHKEQVQQDAQEEELITVDAVGCFEEEEEKEVKEEEVEGEEVAGEGVEDQVLKALRTHGDPGAVLPPAGGSWDCIFTTSQLHAFP